MYDREGKGDTHSGVIEGKARRRVDRHRARVRGGIRTLPTVQLDRLKLGLPIVRISVLLHPLAHHSLVERC